jgi:hypothetical protein
MRRRRGLPKIRGLRERCVASIWCASASVSYCSSSCYDIEPWDHAGGDVPFCDYAQHYRWEKSVMMNASMTKDGNFRASRNPGHQCSRSYSLCTLTSVVSISTIVSRQIWLSIVGVGRPWGVVILSNFIHFITNYVIYLLRCITCELCCLVGCALLKIIWLQYYCFLYIQTIWLENRWKISKTNWSGEDRMS